MCVCVCVCLYMSTIVDFIPMLFHVGRSPISIDRFIIDSVIVKNRQWIHIHKHFVQYLSFVDDILSRMMNKRTQQLYCLHMNNDLSDYTLHIELTSIYCGNVSDLQNQTEQIWYTNIWNERQLKSKIFAISKKKHNTHACNKFTNLNFLNFLCQRTFEHISYSSFEASITFKVCRPILIIYVWNRPLRNTQSKTDFLYIQERFAPTFGRIYKYNLVNCIRASLSKF